MTVPAGASILIGTSQRWLCRQGTFAMIDKTDALRMIRDQILALEASPLYAYRTENKFFPVIGEGSHNAAVMVIGEAPGENEARQGRPFVGASGRLLDELLAEIDLRREDIYITNVVKDRPPENRNPHKKEVAIYAPFLEQQIALIQPRILVTLGRFALEFVAARYAPDVTAPRITQLHGQALPGTAPYGSIHILPLFHPAVALYDPTQKGILSADFRALQSLLSGLT